MEDVHCASEKNHPMENHIRRGIAVNILLVNPMGDEI